MVISLVPSLLFKNEILATTVKNYAKPEFKMFCFYPILFVLFLLSQIFCQGLELKQFRLEVKYLNRSCFLRLRETLIALQLPFFFSSSFFCQPCAGLRNCKSIFLNLKTSQYGGPRRGVERFPRYSCKNWYLHLQKTNGHQIRQAGTSRGVDSNETNQRGAGDTITLRSRDK